MIMNKVYINKRSEMTMIGKAFEAAGFRCLRVRTECNCQHQGNLRDGLILIDADKLRAEIIRCRGCTKNIK